MKWLVLILCLTLPIRAITPISTNEAVIALQMRLPTIDPQISGRSVRPLMMNWQGNDFLENIFLMTCVGKRYCNGWRFYFVTAMHVMDPYFHAGDAPREFSYSANGKMVWQWARSWGNDVSLICVTGLPEAEVEATPVSRETVPYHDKFTQTNGWTCTSISKGDGPDGRQLFRWQDALGKPHHGWKPGYFSDPRAVSMSWGHLNIVGILTGRFRAAAAPGDTYSGAAVSNSGHPLFSRNPVTGEPELLGVAFGGVVASWDDPAGNRFSEDPAKTTIGPLAVADIRGLYTWVGGRFRIPAAVNPRDWPGTSILYNSVSIWAAEIEALIQADCPQSGSPPSTPGKPTVTI